MSIPSPEAMTKIADWRQKARDGTLTRDEMREAISFLRAERTAIPPSTAKPRTSAAKAPAKSADDLLGELGL